MTNHKSDLLPQMTFSILFALSLKPRHGYELAQQIEQDSLGKVRPGAGALYGTIKLLREDNLIEEMPFESENERRRYYRLTRKVLNRLTDEMDYFKNTVRLARERKLLDGNR